MLNNPIVNAMIVFILAITLAVLAGATLYQLTQPTGPDRNVIMAMLAVLSLLEGYVRVAQQTTSLKNGSDH